MMHSILRAATLSLVLPVIASCLEWQTNGPHQFASLSVPRTGQPGFALLAPGTTGITFTNVLSDARGISNQVYMSGSGVAAGDVDGDGLCDLYFCGLDSPNTLYRNLGNWRFENITGPSGTSCGNQASTGAAFSDIDSDGDLDLLVTGIAAGVRLFLNEGTGKFREITRNAGLASEAGSMSMALADIDDDGDLDLYVANYRTATLQDEPGVRFRVATTNGQRVIAQIDGRTITPEERVRYSVAPGGRSIMEHGEIDFLYRNEGKGKFSLLSWTDGTFLDEDGKPITTPYDWGLSVMFRDMNGDRAPDIYVCNDSDSPDRIWLNDGSGKFRAVPRLALRQTCLSSMGVDFADINRDGLDDFFVADMLSRTHVMRHALLLDSYAPQIPGEFERRKQFGRNMLYLNRGDGTYAEIAQLSGVDASDWSWTPVFLDIDLDGFEDLLITTGLERSLRDADARRQIDGIKAQRKLSKQEFLELRRIMPKLASPNFAYRNRGDLTFQEMSTAWGFDSTEVSHGLASTDLDNDGDLDVVVNVMNGPALVYQNNASAPRLAIRLEGKAPNTRGIGAKIKVTGGPVPQSQEMIAGGRYLSTDDSLRVFAAGTGAHTIEVLWRSGTRTVLTNVKANQVCLINEGSARPVLQMSTKPEQPLFRDVSSLLSHRHHETPFNDFDRQPLLPRQLAQLGPGVSWSDLNGDGWDDLLLPSGHGGELGLFLNSRGGGFKRLNALTGKAADDQTTAVSFPRADGLSVLVGTAGYESGAPSSVSRLDVWAGGIEPRDALQPGQQSVGPLALGDVDADGDLDLFAGARLIPGRYPEPASSRLYHNENGKFQPATEWAKLGLVSGAVFTDLTGDGLPELVLACDWGPVRILRNEKGQLTDATEQFGLSSYRGWWNSVAAGDFDGDGRLDLVVGNWGRNSKYQHHSSLQMFYSDVDENGSVEIIEAYHDPDLRKTVPWARWDVLGQIFPFIHGKFAGFKAYSQASVEEIFGEQLKSFRALEALTLDSTVFLNRGNRLEARPLPIEAQFAPVFGISVADFDGDGHLDIFLAQNFFGADSFTSLYDAGRGLVLQGDGIGGFAPLMASRSGIAIYGEQRGSAIADFDSDGRVDLAVAQNGSATRLFRNEAAKPGLRVHLRGPADNPLGIGAVVRVGNDEKLGAAQEIHAGSGYWSQDSSTIVVTASSAISKIWVRWPGGKETTSSVPETAREITVNTTHSVTPTR